MNYRPSVAHEVDDHVPVPGCSPLGGDISHQHNSLGVISVDVEDGGVHHPAHVRAVRAGARVAGVRGEPWAVGKYC